MRKRNKRARDARTGRFVRLLDALRRPATTIVERVRRHDGKEDK